MSTPKPPKQLRITRKQQFDYEYVEPVPADGTYETIKTEAPPLGYAIAYTPNTKAFEKQMKSQDDWAYKPEYGGRGHKIIDGQYYIVDGKWETKNGMTHEEARKFPRDEGFEFVTTETLAPYQPIIIDNVPLEGFRIQHMVARYRGNKLWRILDPRGFELEIMSGTFEDIVMTGVVDHGLIVGPCIWQSSKKLVRV